MGTIHHIKEKQTLAEGLRNLAMMLEKNDKGGDCCTIVIDGTVIQMGEGDMAKPEAAIRNMEAGISNLTENH